MKKDNFITWQKGYKDKYNNSNLFKKNNTITYIYYSKFFFYFNIYFNKED